MLNVNQRVEGNKLVLEIDLTQDHGLSKSEKTKTVASSAGFAKVEGSPIPGVSFSLNVNKKLA